MIALGSYAFDIAALSASLIVLALIIAVLRFARRPGAVSIDFRKFDTLLDEMGSMPRKDGARSSEAPAE